MTKVLELPPSRLVLPRTHGFESQFNQRPPVQTQVYEQAALSAGTDLAAKVIAVFSEPVLITDVSINPEGSFADIDDSNTSVWTILNNAATIVAETFDSTTAFPADTVHTSLGTVANTLVSAGSRLEMSVTNGTTAATPITQVVVSYIPLSSILDGFECIGDDGGSLTFLEEAGGGVDLVTGATDNDEIYLFRNRETFTFADAKPLEFLAKLGFAEANTDDANVIAGLMDAVAANHIQDDGAGPVASYSGAVFFKADGDTVWTFETSLAGTQETTVLSHANPSGANDFHTLKIMARSRDATTVEIVPMIDEAGGMDLRQCTDANGKLVKHTLTLGSPADMQAVVGAKAGGANAETVTVKYLTGYQKR